VLLTRPLSRTRLDELVAEQSPLAPTYAEVGGTRDATFPPGYQHDRYEALLGGDQRSFSAGVAALNRWEAHRGAGVDVTPVDVAIADGATVVLALPLGPFRAIAACRVVYVIDEPDTFGFGYGTLPLHPEQGEEAFLIERDGDGLVWFRLAAFSRPKDRLARIGAPVSRVIQRRVTRGYLRAMTRAVNAP
jgi:uncharacterized protein (UPF0548 family)